MASAGEEDLVVEEDRADAVGPARSIFALRALPGGIQRPDSDRFVGAGGGQHYSAGCEHRGEAGDRSVVSGEDAEVRLYAGTLYSVLDRLREAGLIEVDREEVVRSRLRRYYRITGAGRERLAAETARLRRHADAAGARLADFGPGPQVRPA